MDDRIGLVFSWDPRPKAWVKERGPQDAAPPPAEPIDNEAVQTYFLDPQNGRWQGTILGLKARQIAAELKDRYRSPLMSGLAITQPEVKTRLGVVLEERPERSSSKAPLLLGVLALVALLGGGAFAAQAMLAPAELGSVAGLELPTIALPGTDATQVTPATTAAPESAAATAAPPAPAQGTTRTNAPATTQRPATPVPTAVVNAAPITTISYSARLSNGTTITYTGPSGVLQNTAWDGTFRATQADGQAAFDNLTVYFGPLGNGQAVTISADTLGVYRTSIRITLPKGDQLLSVKFGNKGETRALGTISVR